MHQQIRTEPRTSPADLDALLEVLERAGINMATATGDGIEAHDEFGFAVEHGPDDDGDLDRAIAVLARAGYRVRVVDAASGLFHGVVSHEVGGLRKVIAQAKADPRFAGKVIRDITLGVAPGPGEPVPVQIYFADR